MEAAVRIPAHGQLLLAELEQVVQGLVVDLAVARPACSALGLRGKL